MKLMFLLPIVGAPSQEIKVSQVGYLPGSTKHAMVTKAPTGPVVVRSKDGKVALTVNASEPAVDKDSGDSICQVDFSALKKPGTYHLEVPGVGTSFEFEIGNRIFDHALRLAMRSFLGQRCGMAVSLAPDFPQYQYPACHTSIGQYHESSGKTGTRDVSGGWHDAGDYGKYVVNSGITTGTLLWAFELYKPRLSKLNLDLPESGNRVPDFLDEVKWNLDWMLKMQDEDGGVWHKSTTANFAGWVMPQDDKAPTVVIGTGKEPFKNTTATADFAAVTAIAARVYRPYDRAYADRCLQAARRAWQWVVAHPNELYVNNPPGIATGGYGDRDASDERLWAAAELFRTTREKSFGDYFAANYTKWKPTLKADDPQGWPAVANMAMFTYVLSGKTANPEIKATIEADCDQAALGIVKRIEGNGYRNPLLSSQYFWGSNSGVANYSMMLLIADRIKPNQAYRDAAWDGLHYLLGRNTFATSFVTQVGSKWAMNPHHRPSGADKIVEPWPGLLVGGPNANGKTPPAKEWLDLEARYDLNENAINWNAPLVFILAAAAG